MLDLAGPEVRVQKIEHGEVELLPDSKIKIYADGRIGNNESISVNKEELIQYAKFNSLLKLDDGKITLQVLNKTEEYLECTILTGGVLKSGKSVNVPGVDLHLPFLSEKDKSDVLFAHKNHVDYVALSFVRDGEDILEVTDLLIDQKDDHLSVISKIECPIIFEEASISVISISLPKEMKSTRF